MYVCMYVCMYMYVWYLWYVCMYVWYVCMYGMYVCMYLWYVCMYVCMYMYVWYLPLKDYLLFEIAIESCPEWDLNPRPLNFVQTL